MDKAQEDVLGTDEVVVQKSGFFLGQDQDSSGSVSESFEHAGPPFQQCTHRKGQSFVGQKSL